MPATKRGRRSHRLPSSKPLIVLLDAEDRRALEQVAGDLKLSLSDTVRTLIRSKRSRIRNRTEAEMQAAS